MTDILIRNVPKKTMVVIDEKAKKKRMSRNVYISKMLEEKAISEELKPQLETIKEVLIAIDSKINLLIKNETTCGHYDHKLEGVKKPTCTYNVHKLESVKT